MNDTWKNVRNCYGIFDHCHQYDFYSRNSAMGRWECGLGGAAYFAAGDSTKIMVLVNAILFLPLRQIDPIMRRRRMMMMMPRPIHSRNSKSWSWNISVGCYTFYSPPSRTLTMIMIIVVIILVLAIVSLHRVWKYVKWNTRLLHVPVAAVPEIVATTTTPPPPPIEARVLHCLERFRRYFPCFIIVLHP